MNALSSEWEVNRLTTPSFLSPLDSGWVSPITDTLNPDPSQRILISGTIVTFVLTGHREECDLFSELLSSGPDQTVEAPVVPRRRKKERGADTTHNGV